MRFATTFALLVSFTSLAINAQDLSVDTRWRKFGNTRPRLEREELAQRAIVKLMQYSKTNGEFEGIGFWQSANAYHPMIWRDLYTRTTINKDYVINGLRKAWIGHYDPFGWWGQAALDAWMAYGTQDLLQRAVQTWESVARFQITEGNANSGSIPTKSFPIKKTCYGASMAGGVFWRPDKGEANINSITTGLFMTLSAHLASRTGEQRYRDAAILSARFIKNLMVASDNIVLDSIVSSDCGRSPDGWRFTYNSGKAIEGLSVLADITGDQQWRDLNLRIIAAAVKSPRWQGVDGIITEGGDINNNNDGIGFKAVLIRGLMEAFRRNAANAALRILVHSYVDVQYNALLDLARSGDLYSPAWAGPPSATAIWGQHAALDVLVGAIEAN